MNTINVKIAGAVVEISTEYRFSPGVYRDFRTDEPPEYRVTLTDSDIDFSAAERNPKAKLQIKNPSIMRKFADTLLAFDTVLMHGAVVGVGAEAYLFIAPSHTGKTTHVRLWVENCPDAYFINGDKPFIRFRQDGAILACGSPWAGKENLYTNAMVPLKAIILMERAEENRMERISFAQAFPQLLQQTYRPDDIEKMRKTLRLMQRLDPTVSIWRFKCNNFKNDCFPVAYRALMGRDMP